MSAQLAGCRYFAVEPDEDGELNFSAVPSEVAARSLMLWVNSPSNPSGALSDLGAVADWGRVHGVPVFSDECYAEFTWARSPETVLSHRFDKVVAVHSLSKRSNMAGLRVGFYAGDADLISYLSSVRQHAGLMVPGPVQAAAVVALDDDEHVKLQRKRYLHRMELLAGALRRCGLEAALPAGAFYLWVRAPEWAEPRSEAVGNEPQESAAWVLARAFAETAGMLVSPGDLYGEAGARFVRIAVVEPDDRIELVVKRLQASEHPHLHLQDSEALTVRSDGGIRWLPRRLDLLVSSRPRRPPRAT